MFVQDRQSASPELLDAYCVILFDLVLASVAVFVSVVVVVVAVFVVVVFVLDVALMAMKLFRIEGVLKKSVSMSGDVKRRDLGVCFWGVLSSCDRDEGDECDIDGFTLPKGEGVSEKGASTCWSGSSRKEGSFTVLRSGGGLGMIVVGDELQDFAFSLLAAFSLLLCSLASSLVI